MIWCFFPGRYLPIVSSCGKTRGGKLLPSIPNTDVFFSFFLYTKTGRWEGIDPLRNFTVGVRLQPQNWMKNFQDKYTRSSERRLSLNVSAILRSVTYLGFLQNPEQTGTGNVPVSAKDDLAHTHMHTHLNGWFVTRLTAISIILLLCELSWWVLIVLLFFCVFLLCAMQESCGNEAELTLNEPFTRH